MNRHNQIHNDIKPQNFLVKFCAGDLSLIEIVLTDFGLAGSDSKGGTPIFASPECLANPDRKDKSTDIFSLGRVFLFAIISNEKFLEFLFVPLITGEKEEIMELIKNQPILNLISKMMRIKNRIELHELRKELDSIRQIQLSDTVSNISKIIRKSTSKYSKQYMNNLKHFSLVRVFKRPHLK